MTNNNLVLFLLVLCNPCTGLAQNLSIAPFPVTVKSKPIIDTQAVNAWPTMRFNALLSNNGKFFKYEITSGASEHSSIVVAATDHTWEQEFQEPDYKPIFFSKNDRQFIFKTKDILFFLNLQSKIINKVTNVRIAKSPQNDHGQWIGYLLNDSTETLVLYDLINEEKHTFTHITNFFFDKNGSTLLLQSKKTAGNSSNNTLKLVTLPDCNSRDIWTCPPGNSQNTDALSGNDFNDDGSRLTFIVKHTINRLPYYDLWYYQKGMEKAVLKVNDHTPGIKKGLSVYNSIPKFSRDANFIYFDLYRPDDLPGPHRSAQVDIWNYKDTILQCTQLGQTQPATYTAVIATTDDKVNQLTSDYERIKIYSEIRPEAVVSYNAIGDRFWLNEEDVNWLVSLKDGSRKPLPAGNKDFLFSPGGKYLLYFDRHDYNFYNYNPATEKAVKITANIQPGKLTFRSEFDYDEPENLPRFAIGIAGWGNNDSALFVYDNYDIWRVDPTGKTPARNITNNYGTLHKIKFRFTYGMVNNNIPVLFKSNEPVLLTAYNTSNKYNGFFTTQLYKEQDPKQLVMGPWVFDLSAHNLIPLNPQNFNAGRGMAPVKANNSNVYVIMRQSTRDAPNYFLTSDFTTFKQLTNYQPQKDYNWLSAELVSWKQPDGRYSQGILYKPENFDPKKKYPLIFNYYQQRTHRTYQYPTPEHMIDNIDIAWFVSRGYLVFTPDIYFRYGEPFQSAYNTVVSAANWLMRLPFVDGKKMAINGHSMAGGITNYLITHTDIFAAAVSSAGVSNLISASLQLGKIEYEISRMERMELFMGDSNIWDAPEKYLRNSPVLKVNHVCTPLLIMHNKSDGGMPWAQGLELFLALRRLGKPVWMLQYDKGNHSLWGQPDAASDYTIRATQFFDHYLKGKPMPGWMEHGIPARLKGTERGY